MVSPGWFWILLGVAALVALVIGWLLVDDQDDDQR